MTTNNCSLAPEGWRCTRQPGHDGPCAAVADSDWEYYLEEMSGGRGVKIFFHTVRHAGGKNIARFHDKEVARRIAKLPELERELASKTEELNRAKADYTALKSWWDAIDPDEARRLREALVEIDKLPRDDSSPEVFWFSVKRIVAAAVFAPTN